jgi:hypothetical protein
MTMTLKYGTFPDIVNSPSNAQSAVMDATGERWASIFQIATAGNIAKIHAYAAAVSSADTVKISLQTVNMATGLPSGTIWATATGNKAYGTVSVTGTGWQTVTFTEVAAVAVGDYAAIVIEWNSYVSGDMRFYVIDPVQASSYYFPYCCSDVTATPGTWVKHTAAYHALSICIEYDDGKSYWNGWQFGMGTIAGTSVSSSTTPDEVGNYFQAPIKMRVRGFWYYGDFDNAVTLQLMDASNTVLANAVTDPDLRAAASYELHFIMFDSDPASSYTLEAGTWYRVSILPGASAVIVYEVTVQSNAMFGAWDGGVNFYSTSRADAGSWTNLNTKRWQIGLIYDQLDDGASTGGGGGLPILGGSVVR